MRPLAILAALCATLAATEARACSVPVFRYALERWKPGAFPAAIYHRGELTPGQTAAIEKLRAANVTASLVDLDAADADSVAEYEKHGKGRLPFVVVRHPDAESSAAPAFVGALDDPALARFLDSPARRTIARKLTSGDSAVWVLLLSGDRKADDDAEKLLRAELSRLEKQIVLPEQPEDGSMLLTGVPLKVAFSVVRVSRADAGESAFVRMLLDSEDDLDKAKGPIALPVFGRGRALVALEGETLCAKEIERAAKFLCGACSCRVKELNPGTDLLTSADWDGLLDAEPVAEPTPKKEAAREEVAAVTIPPGRTVPAEPTPPATAYAEPPAEARECACRAWLYGAAGACAALALGCGAWAVFARRSRG